MAKRLQEILNLDAESSLIESEILNIVTEATRARLFGTQVLAMRIGPQSIPGTSMDIPLATKNAMAIHTIGEGQEVPIDREELTTFNLPPLKYGVGPMITKEMIEDHKFDVVERNMREAGWQMARKLDSLLMAQIEAGDTSAGNTVAGGAAITVKNITDAMQNLEAEDYKPNWLIVSPEVANDIRNIADFVHADKAGVTNPSRALIGTIYGMNVGVSSQVTAKYAYVIDSDHALVLLEKRPITLERFDDVTRDLSRMIVTARWGVRYLRDAANAVITTT